MCNGAVRKGLFICSMFPDWFVTQQQIKIWQDDSEYHDNNDEIIEWYDGY